MHSRTLRLSLAFAALLVALARPAAADSTITGTVGEVGAIRATNNNIVSTWIRFKLTDPTQTAACTDQISYWNGQKLITIAGATAKYAWFYEGAGVEREWYALLLVSKKGAPINCTIDGTCQITSCTLP